MGLELMLALKLVDCLESCWNCAIRFFLTKVLLKIKSKFFENNISDLPVYVTKMMFKLLSVAK